MAIIGDLAQRVEAVARLAALGRAADSAIDLAEAALALASFDRPEAGLEDYRRHLAETAEAVRAAHAALGPDSLDTRCRALAAVLAEREGYRGDRATYDDLANANLMTVIDRRRGLPVALGILYIDAGRRQGWPVEGINFPGHFLVRLDHEGERAIVDPFGDGERIDIADLRTLVRLGGGGELMPQHYAPLGSRGILLRLENNIKQRLIAAGELERAAEILERMLLLAPEEPQLLGEAGMLHRRLGNLKTALAHFERLMATGAEGRVRREAGRLIEELRRRMH
jgi:regulator of sirC expression with transglutaminase-like and TPR domain